MNPTKIALLLVCLSGFQFVVARLDYLTYLPNRMFRAGHSSSLASVQVAQMKTKLLVARSITHLTLGAALWLFAPRAAQVLADGLQNPAEEIES